MPAMRVFTLPAIPLVVTTLLLAAPPAWAETPKYLPEKPADEQSVQSGTPDAAEPVKSDIDKALDALAKPKAGPLSFDDNKLDSLFAELKRTRDPDIAQVLAEQVRAEFRVTRSATIDMLVSHADKAMQEKRNAAALDFIDQVIILDPTYVEGWNRRATLHYLTGNPKKSMADIAEVLARDPRHIGALAGMAGILTDAGRKTQALKVWQRYLELYPADKNAQKAYSDLAEELAGQKT